MSTHQLSPENRSAASPSTRLPLGSHFSLKPSAPPRSGGHQTYGAASISRTHRASRAGSVAVSAHHRAVVASHGLRSVCPAYCRCQVVGRSPRRRVAAAGWLGRLWVRFAEFGSPGDLSAGARGWYGGGGCRLADWGACGASDRRSAMADLISEGGGGCDDREGFMGAAVHVTAAGCVPSAV